MIFACALLIALAAPSVAVLLLLRHVHRVEARLEARCDSGAERRTSIEARLRTLECHDEIEGKTLSLRPLVRRGLPPIRVPVPPPEPLKLLGFPVIVDAKQPPGTLRFVGTRPPSAGAADPSSSTGVPR